MNGTIAGVTCGNCTKREGHPVKHPTAQDVRDCYGGRYASSLPRVGEEIMTEAEETRLIQAREREEDERVAAYKAQRDDLAARAVGYVAKQASQNINVGLNTRTNPSCAATPAGRYAVRGEDNTVDFYKVDKPEDGKWRGFTFVSLLIGSVGDWTEQRLDRAHTVAICVKIVAAGVEESTRLFGQKARKCGQCLSPLSTVQSRAAGYGKDCASNHGFWYPSEAEARRLLGEEA